MEHPEATVLLVNTTLLALAYGYVYPRLAGGDGNRLIRLDVITTTVALAIAALLFTGTQTRFSVAGFETNWFWFSIASFMLIEIPFMLWYCQRYDVWRTWRP